MKYLTLLAVMFTSFETVAAPCYFAFEVPAQVAAQSLTSITADKGSIRLAPGVVIERAESGNWGVVEASAETSPQNVIVLLQGGNGDAFGGVLSKLPTSSAVPDCRSFVELEHATQVFSESADSYRKDLLQLEEDIARLKNDADTIGNISRIVTTEDDLGAVQREIDLTTSVKSILEDRIVMIKKQGSPRSYARRESELSSQLVELVSASRNQMRNAATRQSEAQQEINQKAELIDSTKSEHEDLLKRDLARARKERQRLEVSTRVTIAP